MFGSKLDALTLAASRLADRDPKAAEAAIRSGYPFEPFQHHGRHYSVLQMVQQFCRDGFIDRYTGQRLINPGMLRVLSVKLPEAFPYHPNWKTDACHFAYWEFSPTIDHIVPVSQGGADTPENWATTSMMTNSAKSNFTLEQLRWTLKPAGDLCVWDGLSALFIQIVEDDPSLLDVPTISTYYRATKAVLTQQP